MGSARNLYVWARTLVPDRFIVVRAHSGTIALTGLCAMHLSQSSRSLAKQEPKEKW
jgi:hypothetical protein